jgi:hypothetical protein
VENEPVGIPAGEGMVITEIWQDRHRNAQNSVAAHSFSLLDGIASPSLIVGLARRIVADRRGYRENVLADGDTHVARQEFFLFKSLPCINSAFCRLG